MGILTGNNVHDSMVKKSMRSAIRHIHPEDFDTYPALRRAGARNGEARIKPYFSR